MLLSEKCSQRLGYIHDDNNTNDNDNDNNNNNNNSHNKTNNTINDNM